MTRQAFIEQVAAITRTGSDVTIPQLLKLMSDLASLALFPVDLVKVQDVTDAASGTVADDVTVVIYNRANENDVLLALPTGSGRRVLFANLLTQEPQVTCATGSGNFWLAGAGPTVDGIVLESQKTLVLQDVGACWRYVSAV